MRTPRVGIVLSEFGLPSEVWSLRQAEGFDGIEPVFFAQTRAAAGFDLPEGREMHLFGTGAPGPVQRVARKLGLAAGGRPPGKVLAAMRTALLGADLDAVLCHFAWNGVAVHAAIGTALPLVCHVHGRDVTANLRWPANRAALKRALPDFAAVVTVGSHQVKVLQELWPPAQAHLIPCGAPLDRFATHPLPERAEGAPIIYVTVGRLSDEKGVLETLEAFRMVREAGVPAQMIYIGDGPRRADLHAAVAHHGLTQDVTFTGTQTPDQIATHLAASHVYVQHSRSVGGSVEGFGVSLTEGGAAGLPLVSTRLGGIPDQVIEGENGFLGAPEDVPAQAEAMLRLARDEALRRQMGARAREIAQRFDSAGQIAKLEAVLHGVMHR